MKGKRFIASYSGGKDSVLAIHRAVQAGLEPMGLITTFNTDAGRSWFHGVTEGLLQKASASMGIPLTLIRTSGDMYEANFEAELTKAREAGAEVCVFGDIDIEGHLQWCSARCENTGLIPFFPLWKGNRKALVHEFIDAGFSTIVTIVDTSRMPGEFLGKTLDREVLRGIEASGADICGENGEYHTFAYGGPLFSEKVGFTIKETVKRDKHLILSIDG